MQRRRAPERFLATVLFTDIADSTRLAVERGDRDWRGVLERHYQIVRTQLRRFGGREIDSAGDGFFATFDTPARAVACALEIVDATAELGIQLRAGVHTGEVEEMGPRSAGSPCTSRLGSSPPRSRARCGSRRRSGISWPGPGWNSRSEVSTSYAGCRAPGGCSPPRAEPSCALTPSLAGAPRAARQRAPAGSGAIAAHGSSARRPSGRWLRPG